MVRIRPFQEGDRDELWEILHGVLEEGDSFPCEADMPEPEALSRWLGRDIATFVACEGDRLVGAYHVKPNKPGRGSHVANCGYIVRPECRGQGIGTQLVRHSIRQARALCYLAMQFNLVASTNEAAIHVYRKVGFAVVGTLPRAFRHRRCGLVDAHVMYRLL